MSLEAASGPSSRLARTQLALAPRNALARPADRLLPQFACHAKSVAWIGSSPISFPLTNGYGRSNNTNSGPSAGLRAVTFIKTIVVSWDYSFSYDNSFFGIALRSARTREAVSSEESQS